MSKKIKFALYLTPEKKAEVERRYSEDGSRSATAFVEHAVDFYLASLSVENAGAALPTAVKSVIEGRLGVFENRIASLLFKLTVQLDRAMNLLAAYFKLDEDTMRRQCAESVSNVKRTNGQLSFERIARSKDEA